MTDSITPQLVLLAAFAAASGIAGGLSLAVCFLYPHGVAPLQPPDWPPHATHLVTAASRAGWTGHGSLAVLLLAETAAAAGVLCHVYATPAGAPDALHTL